MCHIEVKLGSPFPLIAVNSNELCGPCNKCFIEGFPLTLTMSIPYYPGSKPMGGLLADILIFGEFFKVNLLTQQAYGLILILQYFQ